MRIPSLPLGAAWRRLTRPALLAAVLVVAVAVPARANPPGGDPKHYTHEKIFHLPIRIDEKSRASIKEVQLYLRTPTSAWQRIDQAPPTQQSFKYTATQDGEYWFTLVTIDTKGTAVPSPAELSKLGIEDIVMVVVDTQPPAFDLQPTKVASGDLLLRCTVSDANPDPKAIKITYRGQDQVLHVLEPLPGQPGVFRVPSPEVFLNPVQVSVTDLAGNTTTREVPLGDNVARPAAPAAPANPPAPSGVVQAGAVGNVQGSGVVQAGAVGNVQGSGLAQTGGPAPSHAESMKPNLPETRPASPAPTMLPGGTPRQLINTTRACLDYRIDQVGPSGVGKVEVWLTSDNGNSWQMRCEDIDRRSPAEFDLPATDGLYGVRVVITNGNGFGGRAPTAGEQPQCWIEVDTVPPTVQLREIEPITTGGMLDIRWTATDKNLGSEPVSLYFATNKQGPWVQIGRGLKNDGLYRWAFPRDAGSQFYVRIEVADAAGNVTRVDSPTAVMLDMTEPRASVVGVTGVHGVVTPQRGN
jgi:hypothetical protein